MRGPGSIVRLSASLLDLRRGDCREFLALKARPKVWPVTRYEQSKAPWEVFPLGLVMAVLNMVEFDGTELEAAVHRVVNSAKRPLLAGTAEWLRDVSRAYVEVSAALSDELASGGLQMHPVRPRVLQRRSGATDVRILTAWGRWYEASDGTVREVRRLRYRDPTSVPTTSTVAVAQVAAAGLRTVGGDVYGSIPVETMPDEATAVRVRVAEVGLASGSHAVVLDESVDQIRQNYVSQARPVARTVLAGGTKVPGPQCTRCKIQPGCGALPRMPGLLGVETRGTHLRTWSPTIGRYYTVCPAQAHMYELHLTEREPPRLAVQRGRAVHKWLELAHSRKPTRACSVGDLPDSDQVDITTFGEAIHECAYEEIRPYLLHHLQVCPLRDAKVREVRVEPETTVHDPGSDVLVIAKPDVVLRTASGVVYREVKTAKTASEISVGSVLRRPQVALAVCLVADGAFGNLGQDDPTSPRQGRVEVEYLTPASSSVIDFDTADPIVVTTARGVLTRLVKSWHKDTTFETNPGPWCSSCPSERWCPDAFISDAPTLVVDGVLIDATTGDVLETAPEPSQFAEAVADSMSEPEIELEETDR